jgi:hypothetical protein
MNKTGQAQAGPNIDYRFLRSAVTPTFAVGTRPPVRAGMAELHFHLANDLPDDSRLHFLIVAFQLFAQTPELLAGLG